MASPNPRERPISVATTATAQAEAPPPYSEYDDLVVPPPNEQTQAMLRGGYLVRNQQHQDTQSVREYGPAAAYMRGRAYTAHHNDTITVARAIHPGIKAEGIPFPSEYPTVSRRDVTADDWSYFINCVLRDLEVPNVKGAVATPVTVNEFRERQDMVDSTVDQWNRGFFGPRGIHIVPAYSFHRLALGPDTVRSSSPTPTYRTEQTLSQDDEIMTITIDTSPRSTRAGTPETIRELNGDQTPPGALTPKTVDEELAPPFESRARQNSIPRKPVLPKRPSNVSLGAESTSGQSRNIPIRNIPIGGDKPRRNSHSSDSDSSDSSLDSLSSDDELSYGDVPEIRRTLAEEFQRDPRNKMHLKAALKKIREDVAAQHKAALGVPKQKRFEIQTAAKKHRKEMRGEMKELRKELRTYHRVQRTARKEERKERKQQAKEMKNEGKKLRREHRKEDRHDRLGRGRPSPTQMPAGFPFGGRPGGLGPFGGRHTAPHAGVPGMGVPNHSMPHLGSFPGGLSPHGGSPRGFRFGNDLAADARPHGQGMPPRAMSSVSFDGTGASPSCTRSRSPRPGSAGRGRGMHSLRDLRDMGAMQTEDTSQCPISGRDFFGGRGRRGPAGPIGMAKDFLMAQANASLERLRMDAGNGPAPRAGEEASWGKGNEGQETGVVRK